VEAFVAQAGTAALADKTVVVIGRPTSAALSAFGREPDVVAAEATVDGAVEALARHWLWKEWGGVNAAHRTG
jgi:uroporphyrinogen-III synthase